MRHRVDASSCCWRGLGKTSHQQRRIKQTKRAAWRRALGVNKTSKQNGVVHLVWRVAKKKRYESMTWRKGGSDIGGIEEIAKKIISSEIIVASWRGGGIENETRRNQNSKQRQHLNIEK